MGQKNAAISAATKKKKPVKNRLLDSSDDGNETDDLFTPLTMGRTSKESQEKEKDTIE